MARPKRSQTPASKTGDQTRQSFTVYEGGQGTGFSTETLFQPDILIQSQHQATHQRRFSQEPEKVLMLALLEDSIACFQDNLETSCRRKKALFQDAEEWILDTDASYVFSFASVCEALGLDPDYLRDGLMRWKTARDRGQARESRKRLAS